MILNLLKLVSAFASVLLAVVTLHITFCESEGLKTKSPINKLLNINEICGNPEPPFPPKRKGPMISDKPASAPSLLRNTDTGSSLRENQHHKSEIIPKNERLPEPEVDFLSIVPSDWKGEIDGKIHGETMLEQKFRQPIQIKLMPSITKENKFFVGLSSASSPATIEDFGFDDGSTTTYGTYGTDAKKETYDTGWVSIYSEKKPIIQYQSYSISRGDVISRCFSIVPDKSKMKAELLEKPDHRWQYQEFNSDYNYNYNYMTIITMAAMIIELLF